MSNTQKKRKLQQQRDEQENISINPTPPPPSSSSSSSASPSSSPSLIHTHSAPVIPLNTNIRYDLSYQLVFTFLELTELSKCIQCSHEWYNLIICPAFYRLYHLAEYSPSISTLLNIIHSPFKTFITNVSVDLESCGTAIVPYLSFLPLNRLTLCEVVHDDWSDHEPFLAHTLIRKVAPTLQHITFNQAGECGYQTYSYEMLKNISLLINLKSLHCSFDRSAILLPIHTLKQLQILRLICEQITTINVYEEKLQDILHALSQLTQLHEVILHLQLHIVFTTDIQEWSEMNDVMMKFVEAACNMNSLQQQLDLFICYPIHGDSDESDRFHQYFQHLSKLPHLTSLASHHHSVGHINHTCALPFVDCWPQLNQYSIDEPLEDTHYSILQSCPSLTDLTCYSYPYKVTMDNFKLLHDTGIFMKLAEMNLCGLSCIKEDIPLLQFPLSLLYTCTELVQLYFSYCQVIMDIEEFLQNAAMNWKKMRIFNFHCCDLLDVSLQYHPLIELNRLYSALTIPSTSLNKFWYDGTNKFADENMDLDEDEADHDVSIHEDDSDIE